MKVHHLNCATLRTPAGVLVCHCLAVETPAGLLLVDTGLGLEALRLPRARLGASFPLFCRPRLEEAETALRQIERLGFKSADVRHIVLTHLDIDHAGGLSDFPQATVHLLADELAAFQAPALRRERLLYRPLPAARWRTYSPGAAEWLGFANACPLEGLPEDILLVPLPGHTRGHAGVAVRCEDGWLLHCGDAYFNRGELDGRLSLLGLYANLVQADHAARLESLRRLRALAARASARLFCSHDPSELKNKA
ncbi:MAG: MBL fold metallo-hydrolase [Elusimicrobia bacterium]|nr:MBL fold metallo-hydrolase [Elusimicrobiota bacterium]